MKLYNYWRSSASFRVRIAMNLKEISYEYISVNLINEGGDQLSPAHQARNPMRQVPVLEWEEGGVTRRLAQSLPIIEYLEEKFPSPALLPTDPYLRAQTRMLTEHIQSGIQPLHNLSVLKLAKEFAGGRDGADTEWGRHWTKRGLEALESIVAPLAGTYMIGNTITLADISLVPQLNYARRVQLDISAFPTLARIDETLRQEAAFRAAAPEAQSDAPPR